MRIRKIFTAFTLFMLLSLFLFIRLYGQTSYKGRDIVYYNDMLYRIEEDLDSGRDISEIEDSYDCSIVFSGRIDDPELADLYAREAFVLDLTRDGEYVGKVAWLDKQNRYDDFGATFLILSLIIWVLTLLFGYGLMLMIYNSYVAPTRDLKNFAEELAKGNLDTPLPMRRRNLFEGFAEAFDIMREELKKSQKTRIESEIARKELVASLSHDVKTPVAVIEATCEVLDVKLNRRIEKLKEAGDASGEEIAETEDSLDKIATISSKAQTISTLMSDLLHSNLEDSEKVDINPQEEYTSVIEDYFIKIRNFGDIELKNHIPKCLVYMDRQRMEQVIDNIVGNSVKYAGTKITVSFDEMDDVLMADGKKGSFIRITVKDSGPGVPEDDLPLIAQKYYRGSNASDKSGYGMGMYLVKQYMLKQGGDMEYYNDNGFAVVLMLKKV